MSDEPKYGKTRVSKVLADIDRLRTAIRAHDDEAAEQAWEKVERWTGFIAGSVSRADTITALEAESQRLREALEKADVMLRWADLQWCAHDETHRGGAIWEICDQCGAKWADDEGGRPADAGSQPKQLSDYIETRAALEGE